MGYWNIQRVAQRLLQSWGEIKSEDYKIKNESLPQVKKTKELVFQFHDVHDVPAIMFMIATKRETLICHEPKKVGHLTSTVGSVQAISITLQDVKEIPGNPAPYTDASQ